MADSGGIRAGRAFVELTTKDSELQKGLRSAQKKVAEFGKAIQTVGKDMAVLGGAVVAPIIAAVTKFAAAGDLLDKASKRTGASVEALGALGFAAERDGASFEVLESGLKKMQKTLTDAKGGLKSSADALAQLGVSAADLENLSPDKQFELLADAFAVIEDPAKRTALAMEVFGKGGAALIPLLSNGAAGIQQLRKEFEATGGAISGEAAAAAAEYSDRMTDLQKAIAGVGNSIATAVLPIFTDMVGRMQAIAVATNRWVSENRAAVVAVLKVGAGLVALGTTLLVVGTTINLVAKAIGVLKLALTLAGGATKALGVAFTFLAAHPVVAVLAVVAATVAAVAFAMRASTKEADALSARMGDLLAKGDEQRRLDQLRLERLQQLSDKQQLDNKEKAEAAKLIGELNAQYGDLGVRLDETTGKIAGLSEAQAKANALMKQAAIAELEGQLAGFDAQINALINKLEQRNLLMAAGDTLGITDSEGQIDEEIKALEKQRQAINLRRQALLKGDQAALTGGAEGPGLEGDVEAGRQEALAAKQAAADKVKAAEEAEKQLTDLVAEETRKRRSALENEIADIDARIAKQKELIDAVIAGEKAKQAAELAKPANQIDTAAVADSADKVRVLEAQRSQLDATGAQDKTAAKAKAEEQLIADIARLRIEATTEGIERERAMLAQKHAEELADATKNAQDIAKVKEKHALEAAALEKRLAKQKADSEQTLRDQIAQAQVELNTPEGVGRELALLELERAKALRQAAEEGLDDALVNQLFDLRREQVEARKALSGESRGTFGSLAIQSLQTGIARGVRQAQGALAGKPPGAKAVEAATAKATSQGGEMSNLATLISVAKDQLKELNNIGRELRESRLEWA